MRGEPVLNRRLALEGPAGTADGLGGRQAGWTLRGHHWAEVLARSAGASQEAGREIARARVKITVRASLPGADSRPRAQDRFREGSRIFDILTVTEAGTEGRFLICEAEENLS